MLHSWHVAYRLWVGAGSRGACPWMLPGPENSYHFLPLVTTCFLNLQKAIDVLGREMECPLFWPCLFWTLSLKYRGRHIFLSWVIVIKLIEKKHIVGFGVLKNWTKVTDVWMNQKWKLEMIIPPLKIFLEIICLGWSSLKGKSLKESWEKRRPI